MFRCNLRAALPLAMGAMLLSPAAAAAAAEPVPPGTLAPSVGIQTDAQALAQDAREYARVNQVGLDEAVARLRAQEETVAVTDRIQALFGDRLAGISIDHEPAYRIVVLLTGSTPVADWTVPAGGTRVPVVFRTGAAATREQVVDAIRLHQADIRARLDVPPGMGLDPRTGELVVVVHARDLARTDPARLETELELLTGVPVRIRPQGREREGLVADNRRADGRENMRGGRASCTAGFVVTDGATHGIVTAAHCPDALTYRNPEGSEIPLTFVGQWGGSYQDVQINAADAKQPPLFYADTEADSARVLRSWRNRTSTRAGDIVCHRGVASGYSCSQVELTDYAPPGDLCDGPCAPTWVTVGGPSCRGGDSGGPVFSGSIAFGILKGGSYAASGGCDFYYYMSTDFLPQGWRLLH